MSAAVGVTKAEAATVYKYTSEDVIPTTQRVVECVKDHPIMLVDAFLHTAGPSLIGLGAGYAIGYGIACAVPPLAPIAPPVCAAIGAGIGAGYGIKQYVQGPSAQSMYATWQTNKIGQEVYPILGKYLPADKLLQQNLVCPLTLDLIKVPVRDPQGHIFEESAIFAHLDRPHPPLPRGQADCPLKCQRIDRNSLVYDEDYHRIALATLLPLFNNPNLEEGDRMTLQQYRTNVINTRQQAMASHTDSICRQVIGGEMKEEEGLKKIGALFGRYRLTPNVA